MVDVWSFADVLSWCQFHFKLYPFLTPQRNSYDLQNLIFILNCIIVSIKSFSFKEGVGFLTVKKYWVLSLKHADWPDACFWSFMKDLSVNLTKNYRMMKLSLSLSHCPLSKIKMCYLIPVHNQLYTSNWLQKLE